MPDLFFTPAGITVCVLFLGAVYGITILYDDGKKD